MNYSPLSLIPVEVISVLLPLGPAVVIASSELPAATIGNGSSDTSTDSIGTGSFDSMI